VEERLEKEADKKEGVQLLRTHPGIGLLTSLALVHTLGEVRRFGRKEEVVAFVGLDPLEKSSGEKKRIGSISKHGRGSFGTCSPRRPTPVATKRSDISIYKLAAEEAAPKQKWQRPGGSSSTVTSCFVMVSATRNSFGGAKLVCARCQES